MRNMKYEITRDYINIGNSRSGQSIQDVQFIVSHDTGNPGSSAYGNRNYFENTNPSSSAHTFIDDKYILEIIPLDEKAWHVRYNVSTDNRRYGVNANDAAIAVELCYGGNISFEDAYNRYVWYHAYLVDKFNLNPDENIVGHSTLDPSRRTDPQNALNRHGVSWNDFLNDVDNAYRKYFEGEENLPEPVVGGASVELPIGKGDRGEFVRDIQKDLIKAGYSLPNYGADAIFGSETERAVMRFQRDYHLAVDGLVGQQTLGQLKEVTNSSKASNDFPLPNGILQKGDEGAEVKQVQRALKRLNFDPRYIDGIYGSLTEDAVSRFQSMFSALENDGIYGPNTKRFMEMELEDL
ncbi:Putative peptidoglycan binding domain-containing protein [Salinibacillus kushneri]|uniref:N-acetylmuramoyl-L-alanine amidase n=1 Tax=Salinibacillus kushneri TaxID=237682 RepID=A0A1I0DN63_9BACI|nr:Putative peptidoglycan binding domain-containing protein [Salinibacillus kushneri]